MQSISDAPQCVSHANTKLTVVDGQTGLVLAHNVVSLFLLHVCALVIRLVQNELVGTRPTLECVDAIWVLVRSCDKCNGQAVAAVWTN